jgi:SAM-dependent methyltransferase
MSILSKLKNRLRREEFFPSALGLVISPGYIIRRGLYIGVKSIAPKLTGRVLDFGCGSKPYESLFFNAESYVGVDIETSGHNHKLSKVDYFYDGKTLPFPDNTFDAVVSFEVVEHVFNIEEMLSEIKRVLKANGTLLLTVPFAWDEHEAPYDFARYTSFGIRHILEKSGIEVIETRKTTTYVLAICQIFITYLTQYVRPKNRWLSKLFQIAIIFPLNILSFALNFLLPKRYEYFCNSVVLAKKR